MDKLVSVWEAFAKTFSEFIRFIQLAVWTFADRFVAEAREGYPYVMRSILATVPASSANNNFPAVDFTNNTTDEFVVDYFRFEASTGAGVYAANGTAGSYPGANDFNLRLRIKDVSNNCDLLKVPTEIGLLIEHTNRRWTPCRRIILKGGQNAMLEISVDNVSVNPITNVYVAVHGHMRSRKNVPQ